MEDPKSWDLLTASLAVWNLGVHARPAWAFLVVQGLVRDAEADRAAFLAAVVRESKAGPIIGPSVPWRVASSLRQTGIATPRGARPDPSAQLATARLDMLRKWRR